MDIVENIARAWASMDGREFDDPEHHEGYICDALELVRRSGVSDEITRLRADLIDAKAREAKLREALEPLAEMAQVYDPNDGDGDDVCWSAMAAPKIKHLREARAALSEGGEK